MSFPVGAVIAYAGTDYLGLSAKGWALCDGSLRERATFAELFAAIDTANGTTEPNNFALPNLEGWFLRGRDAGTGRDPDASSRTQAREGANVGDAVGTREEYATRAPDTPFQVDVPNLPTENVKGNVGSLLGDDDALWNDSQPTFAVGGGDAETRPINKYVNFLIKTHSSIDGQPVTMPIGGVLPYPSSNNKWLFDEWLACNGNLLSNLYFYKALFEFIGTAHGGDGNPMYQLPDYQGYFLRGVANGSMVDPGREQRVSPAQIGGNAGDRVGSAQADATAAPHTPFTFTTPHLPESKHKVDGIAGRHAAAYTSSSKSVSFTGGDKETRPKNASVDFYIRFRQKQAEEVVPVGTIAPFFGDADAAEAAPDAPHWRLCDGSELAEQEYPALFDLIGTNYGGGDGVFALPDYRGRFLRGNDYLGNRDAGPRGGGALEESSGNAIGTIQGDSTRMPNAGWATSISKLPPDEKKIAATVVGHTLAKRNSGSVTRPLSGGDAESRPVNVACDFYIRVK